MLSTLKDLFGRLQPPAPGADAQTTEHALRLATAVMLVEVMRADAGTHEAELEAVLAALQDKFQLDADEAARLAELAHTTARASTDLYGFTSHINQHFGMPEKLRMIEHMWRVAYADGQLSAHERHVMWRISDLLHIPQGAYQHARMRAEQASAGGRSG
jgi:uncharacterized tellurite resistance protein B-like protein